MNALTPEQIEMLAQAIKKGAYPATLTSMADWPMLVALGGVICALLIALWRDLHVKIRDLWDEFKEAVTDIRNDWTSREKRLWQEVRRGKRPGMKQ